MPPLRPFPRALLPLSAAAAWACGGGDLALPTDEQLSQVEVVEGDEQTGRPGSRLAEPLLVRLLDQAGNGVPDRTVLWIVKAGGGTISPSTGMTDAQGFASAEWTLGPSAGANMVEAQVPGVGAAPFTATADPDSGAGGAASVDRLVFLAPPRDVERDEFFSIKVVLVDDAGDVVPLSGIFIYVEPFRKGDDFPTNDDLRGERFENTENGIAEFEVAIEEKGEYRLRALTDDLPDLGPHGPEPHLFSDPFEVD